MVLPTRSETNSVGAPAQAVLPTVLILAVVLFWGAASASAQTAAGRKASRTGPGGTVSMTFDDVSVGKLPVGWKVEATRRRGSLATWQVVTDRTAPSGKQVLALTRTNHTSGRTFNLCWTDTVSFLDGEIKVRFKAVKGKEDQGGGVIWRVRDKDNYYIARFNPLEDNFRLYTVHAGVRKMLADAKIALSAGKWHTLRIVQQGNRFAGYLNGKKLVEGTDNLFAKAGGVGLWTKADAVTSFDDFSVKPGE